MAAMAGRTAAAGSASEERPNVIIIMGDDATHSDLPLYGGSNVQTPHIDRLASQGLTFNHAYLAMSMCQPCRAELYTGLYPMRNGCCWNHSACRAGTESIVHHMGDLGYRVGIAGKVHVTPRRSFPFERVPGCERGCVSQTAKADMSGIREFMGRDREQPFCLAVGLVVPHVPWTVGDADHFRPKKLELPPYLADTEQTRKDFARYLAEIEVLDNQVGKVLKTLEETGQAENTIVIFTSEQGAQFPGCKWTNWDQGVHTAFVVRWPGRVQAGRRTDAMIQYADVLPTVLEAAGGDPESKDYDGSSFLPVLLGRADEHREFAYFMHNNVPEGPPYPIRSVRTREYHYIRNLTPDATYIEKHMMGRPEHNPYWRTWMFESWNDQHTYDMVHRYMHRPAEELYRNAGDPHELKNLAEDPQHASAKKRLSAELDRWMQAQKDPGIALDTDKARLARRREAQRYQKQGK